MAPKTPQKGVFCGPGPPLAKPCVSASSPSGAGADPDCRSLRLLCSLRSQRSRHARIFRPCGAQVPRYRDRQSASSTPTRSSLRSLCGPAISRSLWPGRWAACGGLSADTFGEYLLASFPEHEPPRQICRTIGLNKFTNKTRKPHWARADQRGRPHAVLGGLSALLYKLE